MINISVFLDVRRHVGSIDRRIFGGFLEHIGRAIYGGVYDPGNALSDESGFRRDVLAALQPLGMPVVRYPGGNFVSNYDWRDGIGPVAQRPKRPDFAWKTVEPNTFGVDEFMVWRRALGAAPYMVVNLGTLGAKEAAELVEYCNLPCRTFWADQRISNGHPEPYGVKLWGLGNEMDGPWQAGHVPAEVYAQRAFQAAQLMKGFDPGIEVVLSGSTASLTPTYMEWDRKVLDQCWDMVEFISAHCYSNNESRDISRFLAEGVVIDALLDDYAALIRYVRALKKSRKRVYLAVDEWNVWYRENRQDHGWWQTGCPLFEEVYDLQDALVVAQYLSSFMRHADIVKIACLAQIVNVIAPIVTRPNGLLLQSTYHAFALYSQQAKGLSLTPVIEGPAYSAGDRGQVPVLDVAACYDNERSRAVFFLINRGLDHPATVKLNWRGPALKRVEFVMTLSGDDPLAFNTWDRPDVIRPVPGTACIIGEDVAHVQVPALGLAVAVVELAERQQETRPT